MKKTLMAVIALLAMMTVACQHTGKGGKGASKEYEAQVRQRVEQMMQLDADRNVDRLLTSSLQSLQHQAQSVHFQADYFPGFQWNLGVFDACTYEPKVTIEGVKPIDSLHCDVDMRYLDEGCYDERYTLNLLKENGEWKIDDVVYNGGDDGTLRDNCTAFYESMVKTYRTEPAEEIMELLLQEEPLEEHYKDPECIYYDNPAAVRQLIEEIKNCYELFKANPGYTEEYGKQLEEMVERIATHV